MYCKNCGTEVASGTSFCSYCGQATPDTAASDTAVETSDRADRADPQSAPQETAEAFDQSAFETRETDARAEPSGQSGSLGGLLQSAAAPVADGGAAAGSGLRSFLTGAEESDQSANSAVREFLVGTDEQSPIWTFALLGGCYAVVILGLGSLLGGPLTGTGLLAALCLVAGMPLLWLDADGTIAADGLPVDRPLVVVLGVYGLYPVALPAYLAYRLYVGA